MKVRWNPKQQRFPALKGALVVDTFRGQIRVRKWPRKRGKPKSAVTRRQNKWFTAANRLAKRVWPDQISLAMVMTKGTGLYPRDLLLRQMSGGIYDLITSDGVNYKPTSFPREAVVFQGAILENTVPQVLAASGWRILSWQLPVRDTMGMWSVAAPTGLTIPAGVEVVEVVGLVSSVGGIALNQHTIGVQRGATWIGFGQSRQSGFLRASVATGAFTVSAGDFITVQVFPGIGFTTTANEMTSFSLNVLQVTL